ncbi:hypothetical protein D9757_002234 [Collybiopsis confluens]|uniref:DNA (cytosine-5-)-methyltransferase n=1 Tax=Collybiopsis confluens TaxID=2823264 RepID=A0A8H5HZK3_9AGAR|nr:hypothetical protein D9757_002234 [Collybiopsis confluens]
MGYQVRFSPLQAAHYGAPQGRARFFLLAALPNMPLPAFPQPTHYFPRAGVSPRLRLEMDNGRTVAVIRTAQGTALFPMVTIADAVDDLRRFDWKHPWISEWTPKQRLDASKRAETIPSISCTMDSPWWGLSEQDIPYEHSPKTRFQLQARRENLQSNIQHYTRKLPLKTAERVINVQLFPGSDHQGIPEKLAEFQYWNPASSVAKNRSKLSLYKRLDPQSYFRTTITNVSPTAKQSAVIHPLCRRILTVRELLRSQGMPDDFAVCALDDNVITMVLTNHRAVGNAVPWPLSIALGREIKKALQKKWEQREEIIID